MYQSYVQTRKGTTVLMVLVQLRNEKDEGSWVRVHDELCVIKC
jgi:hypothetical protein